LILNAGDDQQVPILHPQISARREPNNNESQNLTTAFYIKLLRHRNSESNEKSSGSGTGSTQPREYN
jgi:hypothetical protein